MSVVSAGSILPTNSSICVVHPPAIVSSFISAAAEFGGHSRDGSISARARTPAIRIFHLGKSVQPFPLSARISCVLQRARTAGLTTSLDTGWDADGRWMENLRPCSPGGSAFINETEAKDAAQDG